MLTQHDDLQVRGFQVAPPELEGVLLDHPEIVDAAVIGVTFPGDKSEYPRAYLVRRDTAAAKKLDEEAIKKYMAERLAKFKRPDGGVVFLKEIVSLLFRFTTIHSLTIWRLPTTN